MNMENHMKTTLNISDQLWKDLKKEAASSRRTMSELVEAAIRRFLDGEKTTNLVGEPNIPVYNAGPFRVDVSDRDALYDLMESDDSR